VVLGSVTHLKRITICKIRRDIAVIRDRNIWAFLSQMDVVSVVVEAVRKQAGS
jgi:hypothetical protein